MKPIAIIFVVIAVSYCLATAQDVHQPPSAMTFSQPQLVNHNQQNKFLYSWNWSSGPAALNQRYQMNSFHTLGTFNTPWEMLASDSNDLNRMPDSLELMWKPWNLHGDNEPLDAPAMMWYPWLPPESSDDNFTSFRNDETGASLPLFSR